MDLFAFLDVNLTITNQMHYLHNDQKYQVSLKHFRRVMIHISNKSTQEMFLKYRKQRTTITAQEIRYLH